MKKIVILLIIALVVGVFAFSKLSSKPSKSLDKDSLQMYYSCEFGYGVGLPKDWVVYDEDFASNQEIILADQTRDAMVKINAAKDEEINSAETVRDAIAKIKDQMSADPDIKLASFKDLSEDQNGGYLAVGEQIIEEENYIFQSQGLVYPNGRILQFHGVIKTDLRANYPENMITDIVTSFVVNKELACKNSSQ